MAVDKISHHYVTVNGVKLHYVRQGAGEPLLLIHGWPGFWYEWHMNIDALAQHYDVIVPDMRGYAYSDKPDLAPEVGYTDTAFAEDIKALCDFYHFDKVRIVSHDFGAIWTQRFARLYPERLHKLMLFDPPYPGIGAALVRAAARAATPGTSSSTSSRGPKISSAPASRRRRSTCATSSRRGPPTRISGPTPRSPRTSRRTRSRAPCAAASTAIARRCAAAPSAGADQKVETQTRVLWGDSDSIIPFAWSDKLGDSFANFDLRKIEGVGHFMMREAPDRINAEIIEFMAG